MSFAINHIFFDELIKFPLFLLSKFHFLVVLGRLVVVLFFSQN